MGRISPGPTRWPPGAERRLVPAKSNLKRQTSGGPGPQPWVLWSCRLPLPVPVWWPLWLSGSSAGGEGVVVRGAAVFPVASSVGVARSPRVGVPSIPRLISGGRWVCAGVIRTASDSFFGGACWGCASPGAVQRSLGVRWRWSLSRGMPFLGVGRGACHGVLFLCVLVPAPAPSWSLGGFLPPRCVASSALSLWAPAPQVGPLRAPLPERPLPSLDLPLPVPFPFPVWWLGGGGRQWPRPGGECPGAIRRGLGGRRGGGGPGLRRRGGHPMPLAA